MTLEVFFLNKEIALSIKEIVSQICSKINLNGKESKYIKIQFGIVKNKKNLEEIKNQTQLNKINLLSTPFVLLSLNYKDNIDLKNCIKVLYPIYIDELKNIIEKKLLNYESISYKNIELVTGDFLKNEQISKKIYLTEMEKNIVNFLFIHRRAKKEKLKNDILYIGKNIDTKSLESHLSRIRKKLIEVEASFTIVPDDNNYIKLN